MKCKMFDGTVANLSVTVSCETVSFASLIILSYTRKRLPSVHAGLQ